MKMIDGKPEYRGAVVSFTSITFTRLFDGLRRWILCTAVSNRFKTD